MPASSAAISAIDTAAGVHCEATKAPRSTGEGARAMDLRSVPTGKPADTRDVRKILEPGLLTRDLPSLLCGLPDGCDARSITRIVKAARGPWKNAAKCLEDWCAHVEDRSPQDRAMEALAWAYHVPLIASVSSPDHAARLVSQLEEISAQGKDCPDPWLAQVLGGELPWVIGHGLTSPPHRRRLLSAGSAATTSLMRELLDGAGMLHGRAWTRWRPLAASWLRCRELGMRRGRLPWPKGIDRQFRAFVRETWRLRRADGSQVLDPPRGSVGDRALLFWLAELLPEEDRRNARRRASPLRDQPHAVSTMGEPAVESEWAGAAVLSGGWSPSAPRLVVNYAQGDVAAELRADNRVLWSGTWHGDTWLDDVLLAVEHGWEQVCWVSDADADYLEIECSLRDGRRLQRQILLAHTDGLLLLADAVLGNPSCSTGRLRHEMRLPLHADVHVVPEADTSELWLRRGARRYRCVPLAFNEWRCGHRNGALGLEEGALCLSSATAGRALYVPLVLDLRSGRARQAITWRQLTVAENREIQPSDSAVGYRLQIGRRNWLIYRSLGDRGNRTVLGHNLVSDFLFGRFLRNGTVEPIVEVE